MAPLTPVTEALDRKGIPYQLHLHAGEVRSLEQAARERGLAPRQIVRSLVFRLEDGSFTMVLMPGQEKVDWPKLRRHLGVSRVTTASAAEVLRETGYEPGAVSPFGLPRPMRILADGGLRRLDVISLGAGIRNAGVLIKLQNLMTALELEWGDFRPD